MVTHAALDLLLSARKFTAQEALAIPGSSGLNAIALAANYIKTDSADVEATYGLLVVTFRWGLGGVIGLPQANQIEAWIPMFLFAMLFGLSMDYEVFLVTRMRETWDEERDNVRAVSYGLERTGLIVTAAAIVMVAAFSGFVAGSIVGLQQFGLGLAVAIFLDATIVRAVLVPSLMAIFGRWNWWLPRGGSRNSLPSSTRST